MIKRKENSLKNLSYIYAKFVLYICMLVWEGQAVTASIFSNSAIMEMLSAVSHVFSFSTMLYFSLQTMPQSQSLNSQNRRLILKNLTA